MIAPYRNRPQRVLQQMLSRDAYVVFALLAAISMLFAPFVMVHAVSGTAWATSEICAPLSQDQKSPHSSSATCTMCCTTVLASALPAPTFSAPAPTQVLAAKPASNLQRAADGVGALRPHVRGPPAAA